MSARTVLVAAVALALAGCELAAYYTQAVGGHFELASRAQPVARLIDDPDTPAALRERLLVASRIRDFASRELLLPDNGSYRAYADLGRPYAVWNVVAAPEFSLAPVQSCFPVAGCVSYRGFYAHDEALRHAAGLRAQGLDVVVQGVPAYSTLGWFDDPLLSTFIGYPDMELARLVFHELAHQLVYAKDDTTFNESFAVALEREGVRRWLKAQGRDADLHAFAEAVRRGAEFAGLMAAARSRLERLYATDLVAAEKRVGKAAAFAALRENYEALKRSRWSGFAGYDRYFAGDELNNALLAAFAAYSQHVPAFEGLLAAEGGDLARFYARVRELAALDKPARERALRER